MTQLENCDKCSRVASFPIYSIHNGRARTLCHTCNMEEYVREKKRALNKIAARMK